MAISLTRVDSNPQTGNTTATQQTPVQQDVDTSLFDKLEDWKEKSMSSKEDFFAAANEYSLFNDVSDELEDKIAQIKDPVKRQEFMDKLYQTDVEAEKEYQAAKDEYKAKRDELGANFDFMEGKDATNRADYEAQLLKLAQGEMKSKDIDGNGAVSLEEFVTGELGGYKFDTKEQLQDAIAYSIGMFNIMDQKMGNSDSSEDLSLAEYQSYYENLDKFVGAEAFNGDNKSAVADGMINFHTASEFDTTMVDKIFSEETFASLQKLGLEYIDKFSK